MSSIAPIFPAVQSEIDALADTLLATLWPPWPFHDPLAGMDLSNLFKDVKPWPRRRHRAWTQRDIARALRAAKAAGVEARVVIEERRVTLVPTKMVPAATDTDENPWEKFRHG
ncbi:MAG: hypothetical protein CR217_18735 [Beijerinckiaceae bacterium]|nr:MAG: hypothetical protein CR217_18735 [Beijerinckiaceae bacterium]